MGTKRGNRTLNEGRSYLSTRSKERCRRITTYRPSMGRRTRRWVVEESGIEGSRVSKVWTITGGWVGVLSVPLVSILFYWSNRITWMGTIRERSRVNYKRCQYTVSMVYLQTSLVQYTGSSVSTTLHLDSHVTNSGTPVLSVWIVESMSERTDMVDLKTHRDGSSCVSSPLSTDLYGPWTLGMGFRGPSGLESLVIPSYPWVDSVHGLGGRWSGSGWIRIKTLELGK